MDTTSSNDQIQSQTTHKVKTLTIFLYFSPSFCTFQTAIVFWQLKKIEFEKSNVEIVSFVDFGTADKSSNLSSSSFFGKYLRIESKFSSLLHVTTEHLLEVICNHFVTFWLFLDESALLPRQILTILTFCFCCSAVFLLRNKLKSKRCSATCSAMPSGCSLLQAARSEMDAMSWEELLSEKATNAPNHWNSKNQVSTCFVAQKKSLFVLCEIDSQRKSWRINSKFWIQKL